MPSPTRAGPAWLIGDDDETVAPMQRSSEPGAADFAGIGNRATLDDVPHLPLGTIAGLPPDQLALLMADAAEALEQVRRVKDWLDGAVDLKYRDRAAMARAAEGKSTGTIRFTDCDFVVVADLPKRVRWDQAKLAEAMEIIRRDWQEDPAQFVRTELKVAESAYSAWPETIRRLFDAGAHRRDRQAHLPHRARPRGGGVMAIDLASLRSTTRADAAAHPAPRRRRHRQDHLRRRRRQVRCSSAPRTASALWKRRTSRSPGPSMR